MAAALPIVKILPTLAEENREENWNYVRVGQGTRGPERLLIVGEGASNRELLTTRLEGRGYSVDIAGDSLDALTKIRHAHYDLVLLEQMMPGMSGLDLLRLLRATYSPSDLPVIMVTPV